MPAPHHSGLKSLEGLATPYLWIPQFNPSFSALLQIHHEAIPTPSARR